MNETPKEEIESEMKEEPKVKKEYIMTDARKENLKKAREKATLLRKQLKERETPKPKPKSKMEKKLEDLKNVDKTEDNNKQDDFTPKPTDYIEPTNINTPKRAEPTIPKVENEEPKDPTSEVEEKPIFDKSVERVSTKEEPEVKPIIIEKKTPPKAEFKREDGFLFI